MKRTDQAAYGGISGTAGASAAGMAHPERIRRILNADPVWAVYALADLQPAFAPHCRWYPVDDGPDTGLALLFSGLEPTVLFTAGSAGAVGRALDVVDLPPAVYMSARLEHFPRLAARCDFAGDVRPMLRMYFAKPAARTTQPAGVVRLHLGDAARLQALYAHGGPFTPDAFSAYQLRDGVFSGMADAEGALLAAGGTHIVDWDQGIAAIGNLYTRPDARGRGYAGAIVQAIVAALQEGGVHTIVLNVDERNVTARRLYERHGFAVHCPYLEGIGVNRDA